MPEHIHFVTGRLAEPALREVLAQLAPQVGFQYSVDVLKITVAALMTAEWITPRVQPPPETSRIVVPGYCRGDLEQLAARLGVPVELGPKDVRDLPQHFGQQRIPAEYGAFDIEILAEINHCPRLTLPQILAEANRLRAAGADLIDVGCEPGDPWSGVEETVRALKSEGHRVSIDSYDPREIAAATRAGAELVLSVNRGNRQQAPDWGCEVVVVPDEIPTLGGLEESIDWLAQRDVPLRIDPILEPIGFGFTASLERYIQVRRQWPEAEIMMGIGNLTELTEVDSAGLNALLLAICQELGIRSVLTTQVINWAQSSVQECDLARRLVYYALQQRRLPKHVDSGLVMLRDQRVNQYHTTQLDDLAEQIKDPNFRLFAAEGLLHLVSAKLHLADADPFELFEKLQATEPKNLDASHAFYLGYEMAKAVTALTLGKDYRQDQALDWGFLTRPEVSHRQRLKDRDQQEPPA